MLTLIPRDRQDEEPGILARIRSGEPIDHYETVRQRKDGSQFDVSLTVSPVRDGTGRIVGASKIARDISDTRRAAAALDKRASEQAALYQFTDKLFRAQSLDNIYNSALEAILSAIRCDRASVLLFDGAGVMRFVRSCCLSDGYRQAVEGHSPWTPETSTVPIWIDNVSSADLEKSLKQTVTAEGIGALAFIPLVAQGKLIGKFMVYYDKPHAFAAPRSILRSRLHGSLASASNACAPSKGATCWSPSSTIASRTRSRRWLRSPTRVSPRVVRPRKRIARSSGACARWRKPTAVSPKQAGRASRSRCCLPTKPRPIGTNVATCGLPDRGLSSIRRVPSASGWPFTN